MSARRIVVTGANSGIGKAMAVQLVAAGHHVVMVCRNEDKARAAAEEIEASAEDGGAVSVHLADLSEREDVERVGAELADGTVDTLVHNAGVHLNSRYATDDGLEMMFAVNHLAPYVLTARLLPALRRSSEPRVVTVSSFGHKLASVRWDDLQCERSFIASIQYCNTKLYNIWFTTELERRADGITASCFHPGAVATGFAQDDAGLLNLGMKIASPFLRSPAKAARTGVFLATSEDAADASGGYYVNSRRRNPTRLARDGESAARMWAVCEELSGVRYPG